MNRNHWREALAPHLRGRPWIISSEVLAGTVGLASTLRELGVERILTVGVGRGAGPLPADRGFAQLLYDRVLPADMMASIRAGDRLLEEPPEDILEAVDRFDPDREAQVIGSFHCSGLPQLGRRVWGGRPAAWRALEDKVIIDALLAEIGLPLSPYRIVAAARGALEAAARELDPGLGTVWAGDAREGFHGGASFTRWVRSAAEADEAARHLGAFCDRARVMPFLEGIPCSIHGFVLPERTLSFRPCEMLVLRRETAPRFVYAGAATSWDPPPGRREEMRTAAKRAGAWLREKLDYQGVFTLDGVMTRDGFRPTELNPRFGAALWVLSRTLTELPMLLLHYAAVAGTPIDWRCEELELLLISEADAHRQVGFGVMGPAAVTESRPIALCRGQGGWRQAEEADTPRTEGVLGPGALGCYLRVALHPEHFEVGTSAAPRVADAMNLLDRELGLGIGQVQPAMDLR